MLRRPLTVAVVLTLAAAGCSSDGEVATATPSSGFTTTTTAPPPSLAITSITTVTTAPQSVTAPTATEASTTKTPTSTVQPDPPPPPTAVAAPTTAAAAGAFPPPGPCRGGDRIETAVADVDGDGLGDIVYQRSGDDLVVGVCTASGAADEVPVAGMGEVFGVFDADRDGQAEIWAGGTTASAAISELYVFVDQRLQPTGLALTDGFSSRLVGGTNYQPAVYHWGCADEAGDNRLELIQYVAFVADGVYRWEKRSTN